MKTQSEYLAGHDHRSKRPEGLIIIEAMTSIAYVMNFAIKQAMKNMFQPPERRVHRGVIKPHKKDDEK